MTYDNQEARLMNELKVNVAAWQNGSAIPDRFGFCIPDQTQRVTMGDNYSPEISWSGAPAETISFALICHDPDVPTDISIVNREDVTIPSEHPRFSFYHWVLADIPADITRLEEGLESTGITPRGKQAGALAHGVRGINMYTDWFANDEQMAGQYGGYDGPCPPWNDDALHHYHFTVYALDVASLNLGNEFGAADVLAAIEGHVLAQGECVGTYTLNPALRT